MEVVVTTGAIGRAKLQSNHYHQQISTKSFLQAGYPSCHPTNSVKALNGNEKSTVNNRNFWLHCCHAGVDTMHTFACSPHAC